MPHSPLVICFGDSLTAGFQSPTRDNPTGQDTPYGRFLEAWLGGRARVRISGICGEVTGEMVLRFRRDVLDHPPAYVPILGGTNDLGWNASPSDIMRNLIQLYEQTLAIGGHPIPVTVPSIRVEGDVGSPDAQEWMTGHLRSRTQLNQLIVEYADRKRLVCVDLFSATVDSDSGQLAVQYSNDGIHLTTAGYQLFAQHIASVLHPLLPQASS